MQPIDRQLDALCPLDGRYYNYTSSLRLIFSERGLILYRIKVEVLYLLKLLKETDIGPDISQHPDFNKLEQKLRYLHDDVNFNVSKVKEIEMKINHDVKSIEYYIKDCIDDFDIDDELKRQVKPYVHFGLTSQDITTLSLWMQLDSTKSLIETYIAKIEHKLQHMFSTTKTLTIVSKTHGQSASPTSLGKEMMVFAERLHHQLEHLKYCYKKAHVKFGGAVGNLNAHDITFPRKEWLTFADSFVEECGFQRAQFTTQIDHYDDMGAIFDSMKRINTILLDLCRDIWLYISRDIFKLSIQKEEVGSSTMPHKVNPINFENAEGNLQLANCIFEFFSRKLPVSRMQRDLTDSTVSRNFGIAFGYSILSYENILKGLDKITPNPIAIRKELEDNFVIIAEAIQTILKTHGHEDAYEQLKKFTRTHARPDIQDFHQFIESLDIEQTVKNRLLCITPYNYIGVFPSNYK